MPFPEGKASRSEEEETAQFILWVLGARRRLLGGRSTILRGCFIHIPFERRKG